MKKTKSTEEKQKSRRTTAARIVMLAAVAALAFIPAASARQTANSATSASTSSAASDPLAAAARRAKEQKKEDSKPAKVFTNDNLPVAGGVSTVGAAPADADTSNDKADKGATTSATAAAPAQGESYWRDKFAKLNKTLEQDQSELDVLQRELGQLNLQNYSDPNKAMQQGYSRTDIDKKTAEISAKQKQIDADKQAISDAQDGLRKSGGDPGWAR